MKRILSVLLSVVIAASSLAVSSFAYEKTAAQAPYAVVLDSEEEIEAVQDEQEPADEEIIPEFEGDTSIYVRYFVSLFNKAVSMIKNAFEYIRKLIIIGTIIK